MPHYLFSYTKPSAFIWEQIENAHDSSVFFTQSWNNYLTQLGYLCEIITVETPEEKIGYLIGVHPRMTRSAISSWWGVFLSPVGNTGTYCQGLCALQPINIETRIAIYKELLIYLTKNKRAFIVKITDWQLHLEPNDLIPAADWRHPLLDAAGLKYVAKATFYVDTQQSEESLWKNLEYKSCKYSINRARKLDLKTQIIEHADEIESFVDIHYRQIVDVCDRKGMKHLPYQNKHHLLKLCQTLFPNHILMIKVVGENEDNELKIMSTAIFVLGKQVSSYFTGASFRHFMKYCPNELMVWEAMKYLNKKGCGNLIFGDTSHYKKKFGTRYAYLPTLVYSSYGYIPRIRLFVKNTYFNLRHFIAKIKKKV